MKKYNRVKEEDAYKLAERIDKLDKKRKDLEKKHDIIQFTTQASQEGLSLKAYIPKKQAESIRLEKGDLITVLVQKLRFAND